MNNTTPIKILTAAVLLTFGFALTANAALINKGVTEMNHEYTVSKTLKVKRRSPRFPSGMSFGVSVPQTRRKSQARLCRGHCLILRQQ